MKLNNIKAHFNLDDEISFNDARYIFRGCNATFTIHQHTKNVVHVTGVKSKRHLYFCAEYIKETFNVGIIKEKIDNQFFSHKSKKILSMRSIYHEISEMENYCVLYEPELFTGMTIKHVNKAFPTIILFSTGSYSILGGKMEYVKYSWELVNTLILKHTLVQHCNLSLSDD